MRFLTILFTFLIVSCSTTPTSPSIPLTGTWEYTENVDVGGIVVKAIFDFLISSDNTYIFKASASIAGTTVILHDEQGIYTVSSNTITFTPSSCKDYDFTLETLEPSTCSGPSVFVLNGSTMSDGTVTMTKK